MLATESRPRTLSWFHAGPLLFGDWGTSRLYVLGLAFYYTAHASPLYLAAMSVLMVGVAWAYSLICRTFPEGGGVYSVARLLSRTLSVVGATLLLCDYTVTAALSTVEGLHYMGVPHGSHADTAILAVIVIVFVGLINWVGARSAARFAMIVAVAALAMSAIIAVASVPFFIEGLRTMSWGHESILGAGHRWQSFVHIVLALSGVEAVANMTGLMKQPVAKTAKRTIWPVLAEVVLLNMIFGIAISGLPQFRDIEKPPQIVYEVEQKLTTDKIPDEIKPLRDTAVKVLATAAGDNLGGPKVGAAFGIASGIVFGMLLLSAANTAIMAMVSVLYALAQDREIPRIFSRLNYSGVPWVGLLVSCAIPCILLAVMTDVGLLAHLYAVGVCGAITISVLGCAINRELTLTFGERSALAVVGTVVLAVELTIIATKPEASLFAGTLIVLILGTRQALILSRGRAPEPKLPEPAIGWLAEINQPAPPIDPSKPRIMLAARGRYQAEFAVDLARRRGGVLFAIFVRTLRVIDVQPGRAPTIADDAAAQEALGTIAALAHQSGIPFMPLYVTSADIAAEILDATVTYGCDTLIMGKTRRSLFARKIVGDVVAEVAEHLPDNVALITRSGDALPPPPSSPAPTVEQ